MMPNISIKRTRQVKELVSLFLENEKFTDYFFAEMQEIIKLDIDETGVKAENEGVIVMTRGISMSEPKKIILDKSFWLVMKE